MTEPDDFGLSPEETLARVGDPTRATLHKAFWTRIWSQITESPRPILHPRARPDPSDPTATHWFPGIRHAEIGCRLEIPPSTPRGVVILLHGYTSVPTLERQIQDEKALLEQGLALLAVRVRGFPGSRLDSIPNAGNQNSGWITQGLDDPDDSLSGAMSFLAPCAVADVIDAARAARNWLIDQNMPQALIAIKAESLGAALAIDAVATINGRLPSETIVNRIVIALPTLCDWPWRMTQPPPVSGTGAEIHALLEKSPKDQKRIILDRLRLIDPVLHAPQVRIPVLCKLAQRDDVAPAPAAAATYNALGSDPGRAWRFIVPFGHFQAGMANARRHAAFEQCARDFLDPEKKPRQTMHPWLDQLHSDPETKP